MFEYFKMKRNEWKVKAMFYGMIVGFVENQKDFIDFIQKLYVAVKDVPADEIRKELITKIAELAHEQAVKERDVEKSA